MQRLFKLRTPWLALILSVAAEIGFFIVAMIASRIGRPDEPVMFVRVWDLFHSLPEAGSNWCIYHIRWHSIQSVGVDILQTAVIFLLATLQWYLLFVVGLVLFRRPSKKSA